MLLQVKRNWWSTGLYAGLASSALVLLVPLLVVDVMDNKFFMNRRECLSTPFDRWTRRRIIIKPAPELGSDPPFLQ